MHLQIYVLHTPCGLNTFALGRATSYFRFEKEIPASRALWTLVDFVLELAGGVGGRDGKSSRDLFSGAILQTQRESHTSQAIEIEPSCCVESLIVVGTQR